MLAIGIDTSNGAVYTSSISFDNCGELEMNREAAKAALSFEGSPPERILIVENELVVDDFNVD